MYSHYLLIFKEPYVLLGILFAVLACLATIKMLLPLAIRLNLVDIPGGRKLHKDPTPLIGGIAIFFAFIIGCSLLPISLHKFRPLFVLSGILVFTGVIDDFHELSAKLRLVVQLLTGTLMAVWGGVNLQNFGDFFFLGNLHVSSEFGMLITICAVVGLINAMNMLDGIDGLVGTITFIIICFLALMGMKVAAFQEASILIILLVSILVYLWFNFPLRKHALIFLGDAGSTFLGFIIVWFSIYLSQSPDNVYEPGSFLWLLTVPLFDIGSMIIRRLLQKRSPLRADREHIHHLLQNYGCNNLVIVLILGGVTILGGSFAMLADHYNLKSDWVILMFVFAFIIYATIVEFLWRKIKVKRKQS